MSKHLSTGPALPYGIYYSAMATSPDGDGVILFGGYVGGGDIDAIMELKSDGQGGVGTTWTILSAKLQYGRSFHVVIPLLMNKDICGLDGIISATGTKCIDSLLHILSLNSILDGVL